MEIQQQDDGRKGRYIVEREGKVLALLEYVWAGKHKIIIEHTEISEALSGYGAGKQFVARSVEDAPESCAVLYCIRRFL